MTLIVGMVASISLILVMGLFCGLMDRFSDLADTLVVSTIGIGLFLGLSYLLGLVIMEGI